VRLALALTATLIASLVALGCGGDTTTVIQQTTTTVESTPASTTSTEATSSTTTASTTAATTTAQSDIDTSGAFTFFQLPSGNIGCAMSKRDVRCDIHNFRYSPPPQPGNCPLEWGDSISVDSGGAQFVCHGDTVFNPDAAVLGYGQQASRDGFTCSSDQTLGVSCHNDAGQGFQLAIQGFALN
jgi:hypothetical protein